MPKIKWQDIIVFWRAECGSDHHLQKAEINVIKLNLCLPKVKKKNISRISIAYLPRIELKRLFNNWQDKHNKNKISLAISFQRHVKIFFTLSLLMTNTGWWNLLLAFLILCRKFRFPIFSNFLSNCLNFWFYQYLLQSRILTKKKKEKEIGKVWSNYSRYIEKVFTFCWRGFKINPHERDSFNCCLIQVFQFEVISKIDFVLKFEAFFRLKCTGWAIIYEVWLYNLKYFSQTFSFLCGCSNNDSRRP